MSELSRELVHENTGQLEFLQRPLRNLLQEKDRWYEEMLLMTYCVQTAIRVRS